LGDLVAGIFHCGDLTVGIYVVILWSESIW